MDQRASAAFLGGVLGVVLVAALWFVRPPVGSSPVGGDVPVPPGPPPMAIDDLYDAFRSRASSASGIPVRLRASEAGELELPTGLVVAADAFFIGLDSEPFRTRLPAGRHRVLLLHAEADAIGDRVVAAMLRAAPGRPVRWEIATRLGEDLATLGPDEIFGYGVDSGTGGFASVEAAARLNAMDFEASEVVADRVLDALLLTQADGGWANVPIGDGSALNLVAFSSGYGDGFYPTWFGFDAGGDAIVLVTDFGVLDAVEAP